MTTLFKRLFPDEPEAPRISAHMVDAVAIEYASGNIVRHGIINQWSLDIESQADLNSWLDKLDGITDTAGKLLYLAEVSAVMNMAEQKFKYTNETDFKTRLGY